MSGRLACALAVAALALAGCSVGAPEEPAAERAQGTPSPAGAAAEPTPQPDLLRPSDVERRPEGSSERALFELWYAIQYRDMLAAYDLLTEDFKREFSPSLKRFGTYVMADHPRWLARPDVLFKRRERGREIVTIRYRRPEPGRPEERFSMTFAREDGLWKLAYDFYLANRLTAR